jgi:membrane protease YdiL (CAAX protease family)
MSVGLVGAALAASDGRIVTFASATLSAEPNAFEYWLNHLAVKALLPIPVFFLVAPAVWWFFKDTWKHLDVEAANRRIELADAGEFDQRPLVALVIVAVMLTLQEYYGGRAFYEEVLRPWLFTLERGGATYLKLVKFDELYGYAWWILSRVLGYVVIPFPLWKLLFPKDSLLDLGLRTHGFTQHLWIYGLCLAIVVPTMLIVAHQPDFGAYYPFYKLSSRSWFDFLAWEAMYFLQFFALELFFRGFLVGTLRRSLGTASIFVMTVPYCMIHFGKPYLEANGAIIAGIVLGSLAAKTKSIYAGFLVHVTVAGCMDVLSLWHRHALPNVLWAP